MINKTIPTALVPFALLVFSAAVFGDQMNVGIAVVDITPPVPYRMSGYFSERLSTGIKDPLLAKAAVFAQGETKAAIVFCDLIGLSPHVSKAARIQASAATNIPMQNIAICATHSHTGPLYWGALRGYFHERTIEQHGKDIHERVDYPKKLTESLVSAIRAAHSSLEPVILKAGYANEDRLSFNRRFHMKNGSVRFNPGQQNPDILRVAGPIDPQVGIIAIAPNSETNAGKEPNAAIVSFALHLDTVGGTEYSADYPKYVEDVLQASINPNFTCLFGTGTCGDINHIDVSKKGRRPASEIGEMLGKTVNARIRDLASVTNPHLAVRSATVAAPIQSFSDERIARAETEMQWVADNRKMSFLDRVETYKINAVQMRDSVTLPLEVQVFRLSDEVAIVTLPGEVFVDLGMAIKVASPFATTLVIELTNDAPGYIPTRKAFAEGSYETVNSRVESGGGEMMVAAAIRLLKELKQ